MWARRDAQRIGHACTPLVEEFDFGFVIRSTVSPNVATVPGDLPTTVIDRETGDVSHWPRVPAQVVAAAYRQQRPERHPPRTVDPAGQLLREIHRLPMPGTTARLTVAGRSYVAQGAKGDVTLNHHPFVSEYLDTVGPTNLVRGVRRHAELIVVSDALYDQDLQRELRGQPPFEFEEYLELLGSSSLEVVQVREPGDPGGGPVTGFCDSCGCALSAMGIAESNWHAEWRPDPRPAPDPHRFPPEVAHALVDAGWRRTPDNVEYAGGMILQTLAVTSGDHRHELFPAVEAALTEFPVLLSARVGPGEEVWISRFDIYPLYAAYSAATLADFGAVLGVRLFPIGVEQPRQSILAVDERGRVFALDQAGEWFLGEDIDAALTTLLLGRAPARVRDDGTW